jgi:hypothetical protein
MPRQGCGLQLPPERLVRRRRQQCAELGHALRLLPVATILSSVKVFCSVKECGSLFQPVACSLGRTYLRHVSASFSLPGEDTRTGYGREVDIGAPHMVSRQREVARCSPITGNRSEGQAPAGAGCG